MKKQETALKTIRLICAGSSEIAAKIREETNSRSVIKNIMRVNRSGICSFSKYCGFSELFFMFRISLPNINILSILCEALLGKAYPASAEDSSKHISGKLFHPACFHLERRAALIARKRRFNHGGISARKLIHAPPAALFF